jgi:hypothetical protein
VPGSVSMMIFLAVDDGNAPAREGGGDAIAGGPEARAGMAKAMGRVTRTEKTTMQVEAVTKPKSTREFGQSERAPTRRDIPPAQIKKLRPNFSKSRQIN